jgi:GLPGLI family protein
MQKIIVTMMALALTVPTQVQAQGDGLADLKAAMIAAKIHQDSIDTSRLVAVYDYECHTQDADGQAVTDRMKLCLLVGQHCTRSFPYRKFRMEREWADGKERAATDFLGLKAREYLGGYDFLSEEELPLLRSESYCMMPEVWTNYPDGKTTVRDAIPPSIYETQEARTPIDWTLTDNTVTIGSYLCKTATCQLHGRRWTVRYCEDIPTTAGPWKLCGLPGLIVEAVSDDDIHRFTLTDLQHATAPVYYETNAITSKTSEEKLIKNRNKTFGNRLYPKNPHYYIADLHSADTAYDNEGMLINGVYVNDKAHVYQPLELE